MSETPTSERPASGAAMDRVVTRPKWRRRAMWAAFAGVGLVAVVVVASRLNRSRDRSLRVGGDRITTAEVKRGQFDDYVQIRGRFIPLKTVFLDTVQGGKVDAVHVENGAVVKPGQLLVELSNTSLQLSVISREAQITEQLNNLRGLELSHAQNKFSRQRELIEVGYQIARLTREIKRNAALAEKGAVARSNLESMRDELVYYKKRRVLLRKTRTTVSRLEKAQLYQLRRSAKQLEGNLTITRKTIDGLHVRAPVAGQLTAFNLEVGQSLSPGQRIGQIDDPSHYKIRADIDEFYLGRVEVGLRAEYHSDSGNYTLTVARIRPQVKNGVFQVDLEFAENEPGNVRRGQTAQLRLQLGKPTPALLVPNGAFYADTGGAWVFVVAPDRTQAVKRKVRLGRRNPKYIEVLDGLRAGEEIVTSAYTGYLKMDRLELTAAGKRGAN